MVPGCAWGLEEEPIPLPALHSTVAVAFVYLEAHAVFKFAVRGNREDTFLPKPPEEAHPRGQLPGQASIISVSAETPGPSLSLPPAPSSSFPLDLKFSKPVKMIGKLRDVCLAGCC